MKHLVISDHGALTVGPFPIPASPSVVIALDTADKVSAATALIEAFDKADIIPGDHQIEVMTSAKFAHVPFFGSVAFNGMGSVAITDDGKTP